MLPVNRDWFISYFPMKMQPISFSFLIVLTRISSAMLKKKGESGHPCPFPDLSEKISGQSALLF